MLHLGDFRRPARPREGEPMSARPQGLAGDGQLHPVQEGFWEEHGLQCGYCTPGMILAGVALLESNPAPSEPEIRHALAGNYCRCTGYQHIVNAIQSASRKMKPVPPKAGPASPKAEPARSRGRARRRK